jgi:type 1 fimbria pilin
MMRKIMISALLALLALASAAESAPGQHTVTVTLNYDFTTDNACSSTVTKGCVQQFNIYDVTSGPPAKLFSIPAPQGASSPVNGISGSSGLLALRSGVHTFGATAQMADGTESLPNASTATAAVLPGAPAGLSVTVN